MAKFLTTVDPDALRKQAARYGATAAAATDINLMKGYSALATELNDAADEVEVHGTLTKSPESSAHYALQFAEHYEQAARAAVHPDAKRTYTELAEHHRNIAREHVDMLHEQERRDHHAAELDATADKSVSRDTMLDLRAGAAASRQRAASLPAEFVSTGEHAELVAKSVELDAQALRVGNSELRQDLWALAAQYRERADAIARRAGA